MHVSNEKIGFVIYFIVGCIVSLFLHPFYIYGDQEFYRDFFKNINNYNEISEAFYFYRNTVGATEPLYLIFSKIISFFFDKDIIYSIINGVFLGVATSLLMRRGLNIFLAIIFVFNFYVMTLFFSAERLKLGLLFLGVFFLMKSNWRFVFLIAAPLFQFQLIIPISSWLIWRFYGGIRSIKLSVLFILIALAILMYYQFYDYLVVYIGSKLESYQDAGWGGGVALVKPLVFIGVAFFAVERENYLRFIFSVTPILVASYFFGSERQTLLAYAVMIYFWSKKRCGFNFPLILASLYFFAQGLFFVDEFLKSGFVG